MYQDLQYRHYYMVQVTPMVYHIGKKLTQDGTYHAQISDDEADAEMATPALSLTTPS